MKNIPAGLVLIIGLFGLVFSLIGLFNSQLDTREVFLVALFGGSIALVSVSARGFSRSRT